MHVLASTPDATCSVLHEVDVLQQHPAASVHKASDKYVCNYCIEKGSEYHDVVLQSNSFGSTSQADQSCLDKLLERWEITFKCNENKRPSLAPLFRAFNATVS
eukprot:4928254-Amphidinium_carterae.1